MINTWIGLPLGLRITLLAVAGLAGGALANHVIYTWCFFPRAISPWAKPHDDAPERKTFDRTPLLGWLGLSRESKIHGSGFWVRPMLIELALAIALPVLYMYEALDGNLFPPINVNANLLANMIAQFEPWGTQIFFGHAVLIVLMVAATFIDFDEQTIPDIITVPGTILALVFASFSLLWFMPVVVPAPKGGAMLAPVTFDFPWPPPGMKWFVSTGLLTGLALWSGWCFALADRRVILRKGFSKAIEFFFAGLVRYPTWKLLLGIWIAGVVWIVGIHALGGPNWHGLLSSLVANGNRRWCCLGDSNRRLAVASQRGDGFW